MNSFGRLLGIDVGGKRVGIARTDLLRTIANTVGTYSPSQSLSEIRKQVSEEGPITGIVVGWPLTPQGDPTHATELVTTFINRLSKQFPDIPIYKMDERFTSKQAMEILIKSGLSKKKRNEKGRLDQAAAALILQQFMEAHPEI